MRAVWGGSTATLFTGHEQKHSGGSCCVWPTIMVFWTAQESLSMLAGTG